MKAATTASWPRTRRPRSASAPPDRPRRASPRRYGSRWTRPGSATTASLTATTRPPTGMASGPDELLGLERAERLAPVERRAVLLERELRQGAGRLHAERVQAEAHGAVGHRPHPDVRVEVVGQVGTDRKASTVTSAGSLSGASHDHLVELGEQGRQPGSRRSVVGHHAPGVVEIERPRSRSTHRVVAIQRGVGEL